MDFNRVTKIILTKTGAEPITVTQGIEAGSISISEILFDGSLEFGAINSNKLELRLYSTVDIKGYKIQLLQGSSFVKDSQGNDTQELVNEQKMFTGYVQSCKLSGYDYYRDIIAYDELYFKKDLNIANFYSGTISQDVQNRYISFFDNDTDYPDKTLKAFREALCGDFLEFTLAEAPDLPNDDMTVEKTVSISSMKFSEMIKMVCELQGTVPNITRDGELEFVQLNANNPKELIGSGVNSAIETENSTFEDYSVNKITQVVLMGEDAEGNQQMAGWSDSANPNNNIFQIENNIFIRGKQETDVKNYANAIYKGIINGVETGGIKDITYTPAEIAMIVSDTSIKLGDIIKIKYEPDYTQDFEFQLNQPSDWSTAYNTYYKVTEWEANDVPEFRANTFFYLYAPASRPNVRSYRVLPNKPTDWDSNYTSYYKISKMSLNNSSSWVNNNTSTDGMYNNSANTYIFKATKALERIVYCTGIELSGSQLVNQTVTCSGEESLSDSTSSSNPEFEALADKAYPIQTSMSVDYFRAKYISTDYIQAKMASFGEAVIGRLTADFVKTETLEANYATINRLNADIADVTSLFASYTKTVDLEAQYAKISTLDTTYLKANMANLGQVGMENFFAKAGIVDELQVGDGYVTGRLVGVKINADVIDTGTLAVERLIIKGNKTDVYTFQPSQPTGWSTSYNTYYRVSGFTSLGNIPKFKPNTYYYKDSNTYYLIQEEPSDWERHPSVYYKASTYTQNSTSTWRTLTNETKTWGTAPNQVRRKVYYNNSNTFIFKKSIGYNDSSILYKLNEGSGEVEGKTLTDDELNTQLNGQIIIAESITATQIHAKAITSNKIDSKAIKSDHIDVGQIEAVHISSGAITADKIKAGSITSECLAVGDFTNYFFVNNASPENSKWRFASNAEFTSDINTSWITDTNGKYIIVDGNKLPISYLTDILTLTPDTVLKFSGSLYLTSGTAELLLIKVEENGDLVPIQFSQLSPSYVYNISDEDQESFESGTTDFGESTNNADSLFKVPDWTGVDALTSSRFKGFRIALHSNNLFFLHNFAIRRADGGDIIAGKIMSRDGNAYFNLDDGEIVTDHAYITGGTIQIGKLSDGQQAEISNGKLKFASKINDTWQDVGSVSSLYHTDNVYSSSTYAWMSFIVEDMKTSPGFLFSKISHGATGDTYTGSTAILTRDNNYTIITQKSIETGVDLSRYDALIHRQGSTNTTSMFLGIGRPLGPKCYGSACISLSAGNGRNSFSESGSDRLLNLHIYANQYGIISPPFVSNTAVLQFDFGDGGNAYTYINQNNVFLKNTKVNFNASSGTPVQVFAVKDNMLNLYAGDIYSKGANVSSTEDIKTNITPSTPVLQSIFENSDIYSYNLTHQEPVINLDGSESFEVDDEGNVVLDDNGDPVPEMQTVADNETSYGFVIGNNYNTPQEVISEDGEHINLYSMASLTWKAVQELYERVKLLEGNTTQSV